MTTPTDRLAALGIALPKVAAPAGSYVPAVISGDLVFTAGQIPFVDGVLVTTGLVGDTVSLEQAAGAARISALNALAAIADVLGDLDRVQQVVKVTGFVASAAGFTAQPAVINGASDLLGEVFGEAGRHARSAVGVAQLPLGAPVEVELVVRFR